MKSHKININRQLHRSVQYPLEGQAQQNQDKQAMVYMRISQTGGAKTKNNWWTKRHKRGWCIGKKGTMRKNRGQKEQDKICKNQISGQTMEMLDKNKCKGQNLSKPKMSGQNTEMLY